MDVATLTATLEANIAAFQTQMRSADSMLKTVKSQMKSVEHAALEVAAALDGVKLKPSKVAETVAGLKTMDRELDVTKRKAIEAAAALDATRISAFGGGTAVRGAGGRFVGSTGPIALGPASPTGTAGFNQAGYGMGGTSFREGAALMDMRIKAQAREDAKMRGAFQMAAASEKQSMAEAVKAWREAENAIQRGPFAMGPAGGRVGSSGFHGKRLFSGEGIPGFERGGNYGWTRNMGIPLEQQMRNAGIDLDSEGGSSRGIGDMLRGLFGGGGGGGGSILTRAGGGGGGGRRRSVFAPGGRSIGDVLGAIVPGGRRATGYGLAAAVTGGASLLAPLLPAVGVLGSIPGLAAAGVTGLATVKLAFEGVGKAIGGNYKEYKLLDEQQRKFVDFVRGPVIQTVNGFKATVGKTLFPGLTSGIKALFNPQAIQTANTILGQMGRTIGGIAQQWGKFLGSPQQMNVFSALVSQGSAFGRQMSGAFISLTKAMENVGIVAAPLTQWMGTMIKRGSDFLALWTGSHSAQTAAFFDSTRKAVTLLVQTVGALGHVLVALVQILGPVGAYLLSVLNPALNKMADWLQKNKGAIDKVVLVIAKAFVGALSTLVTWIEATVKWLTPLVKSILNLFKGLQNATGGVISLKNAFLVLIGLQVLKWVDGIALAIGTSAGGGLLARVILLGAALAPVAAALSAVMASAGDAPSVPGIPGKYGALAGFDPATLKGKDKKQFNSMLSGLIGKYGGGDQPFGTWVKQHPAGAEAINQWLIAHGLGAAGSGTGPSGSRGDMRGGFAQGTSFSRFAAGIGSMLGSSAGGGLGIVPGKALSMVSQYAGVPLGILRAQMNAESGGYQLGKGGTVLTSSAGAQGLMQFMPDTARGEGVDPLNPGQNLVGGARYLRKLYNQYHDWRLALAAYNAGGKHINAGLGYADGILRAAGMGGTDVPGFLPGAGGDPFTIPKTPKGPGPPTSLRLLPQRLQQLIASGKAAVAGAPSTAGLTSGLAPIKTVRAALDSMHAHNKVIAVLEKEIDAHQKLADADKQAITYLEHQHATGKKMRNITEEIRRLEASRAGELKKIHTGHQQINGEVEKEVRVWDKLVKVQEKAKKEAAKQAMFRRQDEILGISPTNAKASVLSLRGQFGKITAEIATDAKNFGFVVPKSMQDSIAKIKKVLKDGIVSPDALANIRSRFGQIKETIASQMDAIKQVLKDKADAAKSIFTNSWQNIMDGINSAFDRTTQRGVQNIQDSFAAQIKSVQDSFEGQIASLQARMSEPVEAAIRQKALQTQKDLMDSAFSSAQAALDLAKAVGHHDQPGILQARQTIYDNQQQQQIDALGTLADQEKEAQDKSLQSQIDALSKQEQAQVDSLQRQSQDAVDGYQRLRELQKQALNNQLQDEMTKLLKGEEPWNTFVDHVSTILAQYGVDAGDAQFVMGANLYNSLYDALQPAFKLWQDYYNFAKAAQAVQNPGGIPARQKISGPGTRGPDSPGFHGFGGLKFAGAFAAGGTVGGAPGTPYWAVVHGGERISPASSAAPALHVTVQTGPVYGAPTKEIAEAWARALRDPLRRELLKLSKRNGQPPSNSVVGLT